MQLVTRLTGSTKALCDHPKGRGAPQVDPDAYRIFSARKTTDRNRRRYRNRASLPGTLGRIRQGARSGYRRNLRLGAVCHPDDCEVHHHPSPYCDVLARLRDFPARAFTRSLLRGHYRHIYISGANEVESEILKRVYGDTLELLLTAFEPATAGDNEATLIDHGN